MSEERVSFTCTNKWMTLALSCPECRHGWDQPIPWGEGVGTIVCPACMYAGPVSTRPPLSSTLNGSFRATAKQDPGSLGTGPGTPSAVAEGSSVAASSTRCASSPAERNPT